MIKNYLSRRAYPIVGFMGLVLGLTPVSASSLVDREDHARGVVTAPTLQRRALVLTGYTEIDGRLQTVENIITIQRNSIIDAEELRDNYCSSIETYLKRSLPILDQRVEKARQQVTLSLEDVKKQRHNIAEARNEWNRLTKITRKTKNEVFGIILKNSSIDEIPDYSAEDAVQDSKLLGSFVGHVQGLLDSLNEAQKLIQDHTRKMMDNLSIINSQRGQPLDVSSMQRLRDATQQIAGRNNLVIEDNQNPSAMTTSPQISAILPDDLT